MVRFRRKGFPGFGIGIHRRKNFRLVEAVYCDSSATLCESEGIAVQFYDRQVAMLSASNPSGSGKLPISAALVRINAR